MKRKVLVSIVLAISFCISAIAQKAKYEYVAPYWFGTIQGGAQYTFCRPYSKGNLFRPTGSVSVGYFFNNNWGMRVNANGIYNRGISQSSWGTKKWYYLYETTNADALMNLRTMFGKERYYPLTVYAIGGLGWYHATENDEAIDLANRRFNVPYAKVGRRNALNARIGLQMEYTLCRNLAVNMEITYNHHIFQPHTFAQGNSQLLIQAGMTLKFGYRSPQWIARYEARKAEEEKLVALEKQAELERKNREKLIIKNDTVWYDEVSYVPLGDSAQWVVFYPIRESVFTAIGTLEEIGQFLQKYPNVKITLNSYADRGTGNPRLNLGYSRARCKEAIKALTKSGVDRNRIKSAEYHGDVIQPFKENDKNRCTIITVTGLKGFKQKKVERKFKIEQKQVQK